MQFQNFFHPATPEEAVALHARFGGRALYVAGATDVLVAFREMDAPQEKTLIDLTGITRMKYIRPDEDYICIGALCTHSELAESPIIRQYAEVLSLGCQTVGSPQIRNRGTLGGNIGNASPAADSFCPLAVLRASVKLLGVGGIRRLPLEQVITGPYRTALAPGELITEICVDKLEGYRQACYKLGRREALAISRLMVSAAAKRGEDGRIEDLRISLGSAFPRPQLFDDVDSIAIGRQPSEAVVQDVAEALSKKLPEIAGVRVSTKYKQPVSRNLAVRLLRTVLEVPNDE